MSKAGKTKRVYWRGPRLNNKKEEKNEVKKV